MVKKCIYCYTGIDESSVVDMCLRCMHQVWGEKMSKAIIDSMTTEKEKGNLELGQVGNTSEHSSSTKTVSESLEPVEVNALGRPLVNDSFEEPTLADIEPWNS